MHRIGANYDPSLGKKRYRYVTMCIFIYDKWRAGPEEGVVVRWMSRGMSFERIPKKHMKIPVRSVSASLRRQTENTLP
jgi:hypothetical protein